jgi:polyisoprenoid-binding protein YceI
MSSANRFSIWAVIAGISVAATAQQRPIDTKKSTVTVQVKKSGLLSAFGHDHEIAAPLAGGTVDPAGRKVELHFHAAALQVRDHGISEKDRGEIQSTMLGSGVLDAQRYPEIAFRSRSAEPAGEDNWKVQGDLTLHGQTRPVMAEVRGQGGHYVGSVRFRQTEFGITPVKVAGGAVRVKDELRIEFDIQPALE